LITTTSRNGFEHMVEATVVNAGVWWIDKDEVTLSKLSGSSVGIRNMNFANFLSKLFGKSAKGVLRTLDDIVSPSLGKERFGGTRRLKGLRGMAWSCGALTGSLDERGKCYGFAWSAIG
jgi:hypothetical protein